jgi:electron transfer flavoprotein alpha subunit
MGADILIYVEIARDGQFKKSTAEVATAGRALADQSGGSLCALVAGQHDHESGMGVLGRHGVDRILHVGGEAFDRYTLAAHAAALVAAAGMCDPQVILLSASLIGKELGPSTAAMLERGLVSDVTALSIDGSGILTTKPRFAGKAIAEIAVGGPAVVSLRPNSMPLAESAREPAVETLTVEAPAETVRLVELQASGEKTLELTEAEVVVSGGRGIGDADKWGIVLDLAAALGAAQGASRAVVDSGWRPHAEQVGQTGKVVSPKLYVAAGISGAIQHLAGMSSSKVIVAVNKDPEAPIFKVADYGIVGDVHEVLPMLTDAVKAFLA